MAILIIATMEKERLIIHDPARSPFSTLWSKAAVEDLFLDEEGVPLTLWMRPPAYLVYGVLSLPIVILITLLLAVAYTFLGLKECWLLLNR